MKNIKEFMEDRNSVNALTTLVIFASGIHFFFIGFLQTDLLYDFFGLGSITLFRLYCVLISLGLFFLALSLYLQNKKIVDKAIESTSKKIKEEATEITQSVEKQIDNFSEKRKADTDLAAQIEEEQKKKVTEDFTKTK